MPTAIRIKGLTKRYSDSSGRAVTVFENLDLEIQCGMTTCVVGPSGCGKTTLLNIIAGLERPDGGTVEFESSFGGNTRVPVGYMFQRDRLLPWRTALQNATLGLEVASPNRSADDARDLLWRFGLKG